MRRLGQPVRTGSRRSSSFAPHAAALLIVTLVAAGCSDALVAPPLDAPPIVRSSLGAGSADPLPSISVGNTFSCALTIDGSPRCWGRNDLGQLDVAPGTYTQMATGIYHTCALRPDGTIACWGYNQLGQATPPAGQYVQIGAGDYVTCAVRIDGDVACWGYDLHGQVSGVPRTAPPYTGTYTHEGPFVQVDAGTRHTCAIRASGEIVCWGLDDVVRTPPSGTFTQVDVGAGYACALRTDGTIVCWGDDSYGQLNVPAGTYVQLSGGGLHTCAVRTDGDITCWGAELYGGMSGTPGNGSGTFTHGGPFAEVRAAAWHTCAVRLDGIIGCWGAGTTDRGFPPHWGQANPPELRTTQSIAFTSAPPAPAILGASYTPIAAGGASGNPIVVSTLTPATCTVSGGMVSFVAVGTCTIAADQAGNTAYLSAARVTQSITVIFEFGASTGGGFDSPVSSTSFNVVRAGQAVPVKFDLGGDQGLGILASGYPLSTEIACPSGDQPLNVVPEATTTAGNSTLAYDQDTELYGYAWKTERAWAGTCREFVLGLIDGTHHRARFQFAR